MGAMKWCPRDFLQERTVVAVPASRTSRSPVGRWISGQGAVPYFFALGHISLSFPLGPISGISGSPPHHCVGNYLALALEFSRLPLA